MSWLAGWSYRKKITVEHDFIDGDLSEFPLYVPIVNDGDIGTRALANGHDIRFTESDGQTLLKYEREYFNITANVCNADIWIKVTTLLAAGTNEIYIYYGNAGASDGEDAPNVWDAHYMAVWHLKEAGVGAANEYKDSTVNVNHGQGGAGDVNKCPDQIDATIYKGQDFIRANFDHIRIPDDATLHKSQFTIETHLKGVADAGAQFQYPVCGGGGSTDWAILYGHSNIAFRNAVVFKDATTWFKTRFCPLLGGIEYFLAGTYDGNLLKAYSNGALTNTSNCGGAVPRSTPGFAYIGVGAGSHFNGILDEVRYSDIARALEWLKFEYHNIREIDNELAWSAEEIPYQIISDIGNIASTEAFGSHKVNLGITPSGIASLETFGNPQLNLKVLLSGIASLEAFGITFINLQQTLLPSGIASLEAFGNLEITQITIYAGKDIVAWLEKEMDIIAYTEKAFEIEATLEKDAGIKAKIKGE